MPQMDGIGAIDLMIGFPSEDPARKYDDVRRLTRDAGSAAMTFPAEHLFRRPPNELPHGADPVEVTLAEMDRAGVAVGMIGNPDGEVAARALRSHPTRFVASLSGAALHDERVRAEVLPAGDRRLRQHPGG